MNNKTIKFFVKNEDIGKRIDLVLSKKIPDLTRSNLKKIILSKNVKVNNDIIYSPSRKVKSSDYVTVILKENKKEIIKGQKIQLNIVFEDNDVLVVNKPAGMVVHPGAGNYESTLVNALIYKYRNKLSNINGVSRPGIIHRIDKETSGLLVVAKNNKAHSEVGKQFAEHTIERTYQALIWGVIRPLNGKIETQIGRSKKNRQLMTTNVRNGKKAITNYITKKVYNIKDIPKISLVECKLETGRTHQIRVHMAYKGNSLLGDKQYGKKNLKFKKINEDFNNKLLNLNRQALHAKSLGFAHPVTKKKLQFYSNLPQDFNKLLKLLDKLAN